MVKVTTKLVTYDVYMALLDIEGSLVPIIQKTLNFDEYFDLLRTLLIFMICSSFGM